MIGCNLIFCVFDQIFDYYGICLDVIGLHDSESTGQFRQYCKTLSRYARPGGSPQRQAVHADRGWRKGSQGRLEP
jgi:hypothetical protein